ncbi:MAG: DmsC/YnfH family molybdoenzyme membrane anchor subunit [Dongiaceae bacterium]
MHPAYSVIFFTTASGGGYGLLIWLGLLAPTLPENRWFALCAFALALLMITAGLLSSTFHLGRPERAWRAFSQWRSSWLSREGVMSVITYAPALLMAAAWVFLQRILPWTGWILALLALATLFCTAMIYASLKTIRRWRHPLTPVGYLVIGLSTGALWLSWLSVIFDRPIAWIAVVALLLAAAVKLAYWYAIDHETGGPTAGTATGLNRFGEVHLFAAPHTSENYLQREMGYQIARKHAVKLRLIALCLGFLLPALLAALALILPAILAFVVLLLAVVGNALGVLTERWLFFAEARHTVMLYYGADTA